MDGKKAEVYLALLSLGSASVQEIAKKAGIQRTTCYEILDFLVQEGMASFTSRGRTRTYHAERPEKLVKQAEEKAERLKQVLPELELLFGGVSARPRIRVYEGVEGIRTVFERTLENTDKRLHAILSIQDIQEVTGAKWFADYTAKRIASGTRLHVIRSEENEVGATYQTSERENRVVHYAPKDMVFNLSIYLYDRTVALIGTRKELFGMLIESEDFHQNLIHLFDTLWQVTRVGKRVD